MGLTSIDRFNGDQLQALSTHTRYEVIDRGNHKSRHRRLFYGICLITHCFGGAVGYWWLR